MKAVEGGRSIKVGRICWKGMFWAWIERVKEWWMMRVVMMTKMSWQVNEEVSRDMTGEADGMKQGADSRDGVMHIWMTDLWFLMRRGDGIVWWTRKSDNRWGAGTARGLNRDKIVKIVRLNGCKNFVGKRKFIFNAFMDLKPVERFENGSDMWWFRSLNNSSAREFWICWSHFSW